MNTRGSRAVGGGLLAAAVLFYSAPAYAYIDPGVTALVMQWLFTTVFGVVGAWVVTPWKYIRQKFRRSKKGESEHSESNKEA